MKERTSREDGRKTLSNSKKDGRLTVGHDLNKIEVGRTPNSNREVYMNTERSPPSWFDNSLCNINQHIMSTELHLLVDSTCIAPG